MTQGRIQVKSHKAYFLLLFGIIAMLGIFFATTATYAAVNSSVTLQAESLQYTREGIVSQQSKRATLFWDGYGTGTVSLPASTTTIDVVASGGMCEGSPEMRLHIDGKLVMDQLVESTTPKTYSVAVNLAKGNHRILLSYMNDFAKDLKTCDKNLYVDKIVFGAPPTPSVPTPPTTTDTTSNTGVVSNAKKLRWAPPKLQNPITLTLGTKSETVSMDKNKDYILKMPPSKKWTTTLDGGRNVVVIGGYLANAPDKDVALYLKNNTGTMHLEGLLIDNKDGGDGDGIAGSSNGTIQIENARILNVNGQKNTRHGDVVQIWGNPDPNTKLNLKIDRLTGTSTNQGLFLRPNVLFKDGKPTNQLTYNRGIELSNIDLYYNNKQQDSRSKGEGGDLLWFSDSSMDPVNCRAADKISLTNVYLGRFATGATERNSVWPDVYNTKCPSSISGKNISWQNSGLLASNGKNKAIVSGYATAGSPQSGEYVPNGVAGVNYKSPGYQTDSTDSTTTPATNTNTSTSNILWQSNYDSATLGTTLSPSWYRAQKPGKASNPTNPAKGTITVREDSMRIVDIVSREKYAKGITQNKPSKNALRVELQPYNSGNGDVTVTGGYVANRAEVYDRQPASASTASSEKWPDPVNSERWYSWSVFVPADYKFDSKNWTVITQFKGRNGGSPPVSVNIKDKNFQLDGFIETANSVDPKTGKIPSKYYENDLGAVKVGQWNTITVGAYWSNNASKGWLQVYRDGKEVVRKYNRPTMSNHLGRLDPIYLKQGLYRSKNWATTNVLYFGPTKIGNTYSVVKDQVSAVPNNTTPAVSVKTKDALLTKPFNAQSPWNQKVSSTQKFSTAFSEWSSVKGYININAYVQPIYFTDASKYQVRSVNVPASWGWPSGVVKLAIPTDAKGAVGTDGAMVVVDIPSNTSYHFWKVTTQSDGSMKVSAWAKASLDGTGWPDLTQTKKQGVGISAVGANYLGGTITGVSLSKGVIDHSLALSLPQDMLAKGPVGPAMYSDACDPGNFPSCNPQGFKEGQKLSIPLSTKKPTGLTPYGSVIWDALVKYGAVITDRSLSSGVFHIDPNSMTTDQKSQLSKVNNTYTSGNSEATQILRALRPLSPAY